MRTLSILAAGTVAAIFLGGSAHAGSFKPGRIDASADSLLHLAQSDGTFKPQRRVRCENDPDCVQQLEEDGEAGKPRKRRPLSEIEQQNLPPADAPQGKKRQRIENAQQPAPEPRPGSQPQPQQLERQRPPEVRKPQLQQARPQQSPQPVEQAQPRREAPRDDFAGLLRDNRPAGELTDAELRRRIERFGQLLQSGRVDGRQEKRVQAALDAYRGELERRITATTGRDVGRIDAGREVRSILSDNRPANRMNDEQLRERISRTRTVLALPGIDPRTENELRGLLAGDRQELRSRVARVERPERREQFGFRPGQQVDRRALRKNMFEAREERRRRLNDPDYRIVIPNRPVQRRAPMPTIPLAEAYDEQILEQLMAPPAYPVDRRYTIDEYRANPALRTLMPGIEVDTVKFGFNEDFLREEEIIKLDRIAEIIERIVAGNPNEVFLIEGHTDLVGSDAYNEDLSWRRAAAVRNALTQFYYIPERNLEIVGYGEQFPRIPTEFEEPENRRSTIRRITPILYGQR
ncbi:MAG: OmpA family protein [Nitratireductor sp.]|nr:OmpA family protein [Nitratireductor sp.]